MDILQELDVGGPHCSSVYKGTPCIAYMTPATYEINGNLVVSI